MTQDATVTRIIDKNTAEVSVDRSSACGGQCPSCKGCSYGSTVKAVAVNKVSAMVGDRVILESRTSQIIGAAALVYLVPFAAFFAGYAMASAAGLAESLTILVSIGSLLAGAYAAAVSQRNKKVQFEIISIN